MKKQSARRLHARVGIFAALFLITSGLTGMLLTFRSSLRPSPVAVPQEHIGKPPIDRFEIISRAEQRGGHRAARVYFSQSPKKPHRIVLSDEAKTSLFLTPSGIFIASRDGRSRGIVGALFDLHTGAIMGRAGELLVAVLGLALVVSSISGLLIWPYMVRQKRQKPKR